MPWIKGQSGNPSGRALKRLPDGRTIKEAAIEHAENALKTLADIAKDEKASDAARVSAANSLLDRAFGKPTQPLSGDDDHPPLSVGDQVNIDLDTAPPQVMEWLAEQYATRLRTH